jgi:hypothetical protein
MKLKLIPLFLALAVMSWAQSTTPNQAPTQEQKSVPADAKANCPCCDKMASADQKGGHACMHHGAIEKDGKEAKSCCAGKDAKDAGACCNGKEDKSCCVGKSSSKDDKASTACCGNDKDGANHEMACCSSKEGENSSHDCCAGMQCGRHDHHDHAAPGN